MDSIDMKLFRKRLKQRCKELKITHKQLAADAGISESSIDKWLRTEPNDYGKEYIPSLDKIYKVSQVLKVSIDYFVNPDMDCLTVTNQMISDHTGLSNNAVECLSAWREQQGNIYSNNLETLNRILEYYHHKPNFIYTLFHYINSFINAHKFQRVQQDMIRYGHGKRFNIIEQGDTITKRKTGKSEVIDTLCTPVNSQTHRGTDVTKLDIINTENNDEQYYISISDIYREYAKSQIIDTLKAIGDIK